MKNLHLHHTNLPRIYYPDTEQPLRRTGSVFMEHAPLSAGLVQPDLSITKFWEVNISQLIFDLLLKQVAS